MFDTIKLMAKAKEFQERMKTLQEDLAQRQTTASSPGGEVTAIVDGRLQLLRVRIDPTKLGEPTDFEALEQHVRIAVASAQQQTAEMIQREMAKLSSEMGL